jgi:hypothetical protein
VLVPARRLRSRRRRLRRGLLTALILTCALCLSGGWLALQGWGARSNLVAAASLAKEISLQVEAGDTIDARRTLAALQAQTAAAHDRTTGVTWWTAAHAPFAGRDVAAIRDIADCIDDLSRRTFPQLIQLDPAALVPSAGRLDLAALQAAGPALAAAQTGTEEIRKRLGAIVTANLLPPVRAAVTQLQTQVTRLAALLAVARRGAALLPGLLGTGRPRTYLLLLQNLAESRSTGGMIGAYAVIRADNGHLSLVSHGASSNLGTFGRPVLPVSAGTEAIYTNRLGMFPADVNLTPDFPTAAMYFREMYRRRGGTTVDGVLAADPVALSYLLAVSGPVGLPSGPALTTANAVSTLLSRSYMHIASAASRHDYFGDSLATVFDAVLHRSMSPRSLLDALGRAAAERRLLFWSARPDEESVILDTPLAGVLPTQEAVSTVGVFLNDGSGSKLDYYLTHSAAVTVGRCRSDGRRELDLRVTLGSSAPSSGLPDGVLGLKLGPTPYTARVVLYIFSPAHGSLIAARLDARAIPIGSGTQAGRHVGVVGVDVPPGGQRVLDVNLLTAVAASGSAQLWLTPGVAPWTTRINSAPACA